MGERIFYQSHQCEGYHARVTIEWTTPKGVEGDLLPAWRMQSAEAIADAILAFSGPKMRDMVQAMRGFTAPSREVSSE